MRKSYGAGFAGIGIGYAIVCMLTAALILWKRTLQPVRAPASHPRTIFKRQFKFGLTLHTRPSVSPSSSPRALQIRAHHPWLLALQATVMSAFGLYLCLKVSSDDVRFKWDPDD